ncbi:lipopolysaccharide assembly protein LapB [Methylovorus sp. MP688]|uniref:tetratricopeptide repeat protein n=1 Tax=Methylovorus sp. (strain MP688) TaxID=887061 RepID=UPI0001EC4316|nr:tetratricopeptide repeat protein [Methylovorus sp. MP688]ADQ83279.1 Tetratricopeptide TPR_2 repeat protein [Methylovorus sp. MP688]
MSLLIKALSRAEQGKSSGDAATAETLSLEPQVAAGNTREAERAPAGDRATASTLMQAKPRHSGISPTTLSVLGLVLLLALLGGYFLYDYLQSLAKPDIVMAKMAPPEVPAAPSSPVDEELSVADDSPPAATSSAEVFSNKHPVPSAGADSALDMSAPAKSPAAAKAAPQVFGATPDLPTASTFTVSKSNIAPAVNPNLIAAYKAWQAGDIASAQKQYRMVLQSDSGNVDALLGMAAIALQQGRQADARGWYSKVLELDPRNPTAQSALIGIGEAADPLGSESALKNLLAQQPEAAHLHAMLGNLYASQQQWAAAQQAYFQAHHFAPDNVDYLFNLAVSLDQMGKPALALPYYLQTLQRLPAAGASQVDRAQLEARIAQLQP